MAEAVYPPTTVDHIQAPGIPIHLRVHAPAAIGGMVIAVNPQVPLQDHRVPIPQEVVEEMEPGMIIPHVVVKPPHIQQEAIHQEAAHVHTHQADADRIATMIGAHAHVDPTLPQEVTILDIHPPADHALIHPVAAHPVNGLTMAHAHADQALQPHHLADQLDRHLAHVHQAITGCLIAAAGVCPTADLVAQADQHLHQLQEVPVHHPVPAHQAITG